MGILSALFGLKKQSKKIVSEPTPQVQPISFGEIITKTTHGANLVDGKQTGELFDEFKHDIEVMKRCCEAELMTMEKAGLVPAPAYFLRVAILSRKARDYVQEISYCEKYINVVEAYYAKHGTNGIYDVREGPTYKSIINRLPKARELLKNILE